MKEKPVELRWKERQGLYCEVVPSCLYQPRWLWRGKRYCGTHMNAARRKDESNG